MSEAVLNTHEETTALCTHIYQRGTDVLVRFRIETTANVGAYKEHKYLPLICTDIVNVQLGHVTVVRGYGEQFEVGTRYPCKVTIFDR